MKEIMKDLRSLRGKVPKQTIKTIRGQAIAGEIEAARKGLDKIKGLQERKKSHEGSTM